MNTELIIPIHDEVFTSDDIEDVEVIIRAKGFKYRLIPKIGEEHAKSCRIKMTELLLNNHNVQKIDQ